MDNQLFGFCIAFAYLWLPLVTRRPLASAFHTVQPSQHKNPQSFPSHESHNPPPSSTRLLSVKHSSRLLPPSFQSSEKRLSSSIDWLSVAFRLLPLLIRDRQQLTHHPDLTGIFSNASTAASPLAVLARTKFSAAPAFLLPPYTTHTSRTQLRQAQTVFGFSAMGEILHKFTSTPRQLLLLNSSHRIHQQVYLYSQIVY